MLLDVEDLRPPRVREIASTLALEPEAVERFLIRAERLGRVAKVADNRFFLPDTLARLVEIGLELAEGSPEGTFTAATFKDRSGVGRNLTIKGSSSISTRWAQPVAKGTPASCCAAGKPFPAKPGAEEHRARWLARTSNPLEGAWRPR